MAYKITLPLFADERGKLAVLEKQLPFQIRRVFFIYDVKAPRGGHRHKQSRLALVALNGNVRVHCNNGKKTEDFDLSTPAEALIVPPEDWHTMEFSPGAVLLALASAEYDKNDYIYENYP